MIFQTVNTDKEETVSFYLMLHYLLNVTLLISLTLGLASQDDGTIESGLRCTWMHLHLVLRQGEGAAVPVTWPEVQTSSGPCGRNHIYFQRRQSQAVGPGMCLILTIQPHSRSMLAERLPMGNCALETMLLGRGLGKAFLLSEALSQVPS